MPRLTTKLPTYRKHPSGQAIVKLNGVVHYLGKYGSRSSKVQYDRLVSQWLASNRSPTFGVPEDKKEITVVQIIREYRKWAESYYRDENGKPTGTAENMRPIMKRLRLWYGSESAENFTSLAFKDVIRRLIADGLSISTINDAICRIKHMFRWASSEKLVAVTVYQELDTVQMERQGRSKAKPKRVVQAVSDVDIEATLPHLPAMVRDMVRLQRLTGARPGELCKLRVSEIKAVGDVLVYEPEHHKNKHHGKSRTIVIAGEAIDILKPYMDGESDYVFSSVKSMMQSLAERTANRVTPLSCGNKPKSDRKVNGSDKYREDSYRRAIKRGCEAAKIAPWSPNQLRHAAAVSIQESLGIEAVAAVLGHSKIDTSKIYAKHNLALAIEAAKAITGGKADAKA